jgi:hypothetical protein
MADFITQINEATSGEKPEILGAVALAVDRDGTLLAALQTSVQYERSTSMDAGEIHDTL